MAIPDNDLICNFKKCRKRLTEVAWVTSCSHTFCEEDGTREFSKSFQCPACNHKLEGTHDVIRQDLKPTEQWKCMILAALKPEIIMEVASRGMTYWTYQAHTERMYNEYAVKRSKESRDKLETYYEQIVNKLQAEVKSAKNDIQAKNKELNETRRRYNELTEQHQEKTRQYQKLQIGYDTLRRKTINPAAMDEDVEAYHRKGPPDSSREQFKKDHQIQMAFGSRLLGSSRNIPNTVNNGEPIFPTERPSKVPRTPPPAAQSDFFVLKPYPTPSQLSQNSQNGAKKK